MASSLTFPVRRHDPVLIPPARPTPNELKPLSDIDDQQSLRFHISGIHFFPNSPSMAGQDPARVIREALAEALVFYYPLAGRLCETAGGKLVVKCTGEGVLFVEADAGITLQEFGDQMKPPFPCIEELLYEVEGSAGMVNSPLFIGQVTRLVCGGFIFAHRINHAVADATGTVQFLEAIADIARGATVPTILPVWKRELLTAQSPPCPTHPHSEYHELPHPDTNDQTTTQTLVQHSFIFGPREMSSIRAQLPPSLRTWTQFEILTGFIWRARVIALDCNPEDETRTLLVVNSRGRCNISLPVGYYGNAFAFLAARSAAGELCSRRLEYAVELVREAKAGFDKSYMQSVADLMVLRGRPAIVTASTVFVVSDLRRAGFEAVDFGWGEAVYAGPALRMSEPIGHTTFYTRLNDEEVLVPMCLPGLAMETFKEEIKKICHA